MLRQLKNLSRKTSDTQKQLKNKNLCSASVNIYLKKRVISTKNKIMVFAERKGLPAACHKCAETGFLDSYSAPGSEILTSAPAGATPDFKKIDRF